MDNERRDSVGSKENAETHRRNSKDNTEYVPTRCRITKPIPPKPATNPMQFVKIGPCELYRKAQEQLKKVEEVKNVRAEIRDEAEDWQANLDNWKSSRRKRQEHIIERVVEVKKFEQQGVEKGRRKSKTFNEILEERNKRKNKPCISLFNNDDPNDLSDYGIGTSPNYSSDTNNSNETPKTHEDDDTETNNKEKCDLTENETETYEKENNTQQSNAAENTSKENAEEINEEVQDTNKPDNNNQIENRYDLKKKSWQDNYKKEIESAQPEPEQYTYESAIQGYRTRVISKTNLNSSVPMPLYVTEKKPEKSETNLEISAIMPKGSILKRKEIFENDKIYELNHLESNCSRRLSDDFAHSQSLKERLLSLEKCTDQPLRSTESTKYYTENASAATRTTYTDKIDVKNNNVNRNNSDQYVRNRVSRINNLNETTTTYETEEKHTKPKSPPACPKWSDKSTCYSSSDNDVFVSKLNNIHRSLDNLTDVSHNTIQLDRVQSLEGLEYCHSNYPASNSSTELLVLSSQYGDTDREDSGIHTADVSCSVSQADEPVEDAELSHTVNTEKTCFVQEVVPATNVCVNSQSEEESSVDGNMPVVSPFSTENNEYLNVYNLGFEGVFVGDEFPLGPPVAALEPPKEKPPPPPVNDSDVDFSEECELTRLNSTKRIKKEMRMKRSSFLGIEPDDQIEVEASIRKPPDINSFLQKESRLEKQLYKKNQSSYSEAGDSQDSGVELERGRLSSDTWCSSLPDSASGLNVLGHSRQSSEPCTTNSITSEEDEITKKEREIIELVEKEEKWRDKNEFSDCNTFNNNEQAPLIQNIDSNKSPVDHLKRDTVSNYAPIDDDEHSEVLRVEHELLQLEREELKRQRENMVFRESRACLQSNVCLKNKRLSLEDISGSNKSQPQYMYQTENMDYRKSMPELQREVPIQTYNLRAQSSGLISRVPYVTPVKYPKPPVREVYERETFDIRKPNKDFISNDDSYQRSSASGKVIHPISRHSLQMLSAAPRSRLIPQDNWIHPKSIPSESRDTFNYNQHWLIQEAEQRRLSEQKYMSPPMRNWKYQRSEKHLPDSVIQTITQRVQNKVNLSDRNAIGRRMDTAPGHYSTHSSHSVGHALPIHHPHLMMEESQDKMLSVSGKKKCSYCGNELGRGAAMIIESLCLFYHMECFKCCVCHMQLGDGLIGTDVRVRNNKLHCHNCYSSDDGVKFSCV